MKRIQGDELEYYNPYTVKKDKKLIVRDKVCGGYFNGGYWSDGCYIIKSDKPAKTNYPINTESDIPKYIEEYKTEIIGPGFISGICWHYSFMTPYCHVFVYEGRHYYFQAKYVDNILSHYPNAQIYMAKDGIMVFILNDEIVGMIMSIRYGDVELSNYQWERYQKLNFGDIRKAA